VTRNLGETRLTDAVFLEVAKTFDTIWVDNLLYKLTVVNFPSYLVKIIFCLQDQTFESPFQTATSTRCSMRAEVAQGGQSFPVLVSLYVKDMPVPSHHAKLPFEDDTAI
jgi:type IV secretory pathway VirB3-like protein